MPRKISTKFFMRLPASLPCARDSATTFARLQLGYYFRTHATRLRLQTVFQRHQLREEVRELVLQCARRPRVAVCASERAHVFAEPRGEFACARSRVAYTRLELRRVKLFARRFNVLLKLRRLLSEEGGSDFPRRRLLREELPHARLRP